MPPKVDDLGKLLTIREDGLVRLDGIAIARRVCRNGKVFLSFMDRDRMRSNLRKTPHVEIPLDVFSKAIALQGSEADEHTIHSPME